MFWVITTHPQVGVTCVCVSVSYGCCCFAWLENAMNSNNFWICCISLCFFVGVGFTALFSYLSTYIEIQLNAYTYVCWARVCEWVCVCVWVWVTTPNPREPAFAFLIALTSCQLATFFVLVEGCDRLDGLAVGRFHSRYIEYITPILAPNQRVLLLINSN